MVKLFTELMSDVYLSVRERKRTWSQGARQRSVSALSRGTSGHQAPPFAAYTINPCVGSGTMGTKSPKITDLWGQEMRAEEKHTM